MGMPSSVARPANQIFSSFDSNLWTSIATETVSSSQFRSLFVGLPNLFAFMRCALHP
jgi:hypothetical protein